MDLRLNQSGSAPAIAALLRKHGIEPLDCDGNAELDVAEDDADPAEVNAAAREITEILEASKAELAKDLLAVAARPCVAGQREFAGFRHRLSRAWKRPLRLMRTTGAISFELGAELNAQGRQAAFDEEQVLFDVLMQLHATGCRTFFEIETLMRSGLPDGAHARWRSLHETAVTALFISKCGEEAARLYRVHETVHRCRGALEYQRHCERLGHEPLLHEEVKAAEEEMSDLLRQLGNSAKRFEAHYGWAAVLLSKERYGLEAMEKEVELDHWRPYYRLASHNVHPYSRPTGAQLGCASEFGPLLLAGPSNLGLAEPGHGACLSLLHVCASFLPHWSSLQLLVLFRALTALVDRAGDEFLAAHRGLEESAVPAGPRRGVETKVVNIDLSRYSA